MCPSTESFVRGNCIRLVRPGTTSRCHCICLVRPVTMSRCHCICLVRPVTMSRCSCICLVRPVYELLLRVMLWLVVMQV